MKRIFSILLLFLIPLPSHAQDPEKAIDKLRDTHKPLELERVIDGDTIEAGGKTIRLWGIDAPESHTDKGPVATQFLKSFIKDRKLRCKFIEKDRYDRHVIHCYSDGSNVGSVMAQTGMAEHYSRYSVDY